MSTRIGRELSAVAIALLAALAIGSLLMLIVGASPGRVWGQLIREVATDPYQFGEVLYYATSLGLTGLAVALALDAGMFNIGVEGQLVAGAVACAAVGGALPAGTPSVIAVIACMIAAAAAGGAVGAAIGLIKVTRGVHEVVTSFMLNEIIVGLAAWIGYEWLYVAGTTRSAPVIEPARLTQFGFAGARVSSALVITVAAIAAVGWLRTFTTWGAAWRVVGYDGEAARVAGIAVGRVRIAVMAGSGALAGLASTNFVLGDTHAFEGGLGSGFGYLGISVALLGRIHPFGVALAALAIGLLSASGLIVGGHVSKELFEVLQGVIVLAIAVAVAWVHRQARRGQEAR